ncbi:MAG TPA: bacillithiol system redox-active protein YtxJ [Pseudogracilibacillus sp.]|nr:bacillithiol system redox-active protein YtxJ [Pseudogracilibacillus sp.]
MAEPKELTEVADLKEVWKASEESPVLLFKLSTTCPINAEAFKEYTTFLNNDDVNRDAYFVKIQDSRPVSDKIAEELQVQHESPQLFIIKDGEQVWHTSENITAEKIVEALEEV